jgi:hypothetical protein
MAMTAVVKAFSHAKAVSSAYGARADVEALKTIVIFCGIGLVMSLLLAGVGAYQPLEPRINGLDVMDWI